jgi:tRNA threonylcarbamoyladenosine biosynthesis protein TsaE
MQTSQIELADVDLDRLRMLAKILVKELPKSVVIGLVGTLGAGKTRFVQFLVEYASNSSAEVTSPTFTLVQSYAGSPNVHHLDAYRVADEDEFLELGVEELFDDDEAWTIVEWADRVEFVMPRNTLWVVIQIEHDPARRQVTLRCTDSELISRIAAATSHLQSIPES